MKQLLLLFAIHFLIFYQKEKDKKDKFLVTLEKKTSVTVKPQKDWDFLLFSQLPGRDSLNSSHRPTQTANNFWSYSYLSIR
jgi:hypothetical protein